MKKNMHKLLATAIVLTLTAIPTATFANGTPAAQVVSSEETVSSRIVTMNSARVLKPNEPIVVTAMEDCTLYVDNSNPYDRAEGGIQPAVEYLEFDGAKKVTLTAGVPTSIDVPDIAQYSMDIDSKVVLFAVNAAGEVSLVDSVTFAQDYQPTAFTLPSSLHTIGYPVYTGYVNRSVPVRYLVPASVTVTDHASLEALVASGEARKQLINVHKQGIISTSGLVERDYVMYAVNPFGQVVKGTQVLTFTNGSPAPLVSNIVTKSTEVTVSGLKRGDFVEVYNNSDQHSGRLLSSGTVASGKSSITLSFANPIDVGYVYVRVTQPGKTASLFTEAKVGNPQFYPFAPEIAFDGENWLDAGTPIAVQSHLDATVYLVPNVTDIGLYFDTQLAIANAVSSVNVKAFEKATFDTTGLNSPKGYVIIPVTRGMEGLPTEVFRFKN